jgi:aminoglycoside phosphotransferase family enzyme
MTRKAYPEFHKALLDQTVYPSATRRIKFEETPLSYLYKTGDHVYKIAKPNPHMSSVALKERYALDALRLGQIWGGDCYEAVVPVVRTDGGYALSGEGVAVDYAVRMKQLSGHYFGNELLAAGKLTPTLIGRVARFLAEQHTAHPVVDHAAELGHAEHFRSLFEEIVYQVKKYTGQAVTETMLDIVVRPVERFIDDGRKLFQRRQKRGRTVEGHGDFVPEHVFLKGKEVVAITPIDTPLKFRQLDAANDVATFCNALHMAGAAEAEELFIKRYVSASHDRDLIKLLPAYEVMQALRGGLDYCERRVELAETDPEFRAFTQSAQERFSLAVHRAREVPREL